MISSSGRDDGARSAERPARAALRQPTAVADSFFVISSSGRDDGARSAERPARAALRQPTAVADSFFVISGSGRRTMASGGRGDRCRRRIHRVGASAASYGVIAKNAKFCSTYVGASASRSPGCAGRCSERSAEFGSVNHVLYPHSRARGWAARCHLICATCSIGLAGAAAAGRTIDGEVAGGAVADSFFVISSSGRDDGARSAERPARAALRQPTAVADSFFVISSSGATMELGRSGERPTRASRCGSRPPSPILFSMISSSGRDDGARSVRTTRSGRAGGSSTAVADSLFS